MAIVKRLGPAERNDQKFGNDWRKVFHYQLVRALCNPSLTNYVDCSDDNLARLCAIMGTNKWMGLPLDEKIFLYVLSIVMKRAFNGTILTDDQHTQLGRHMATLTVRDKIELGDGLTLVFRQTMLWDMPGFLANNPLSRRLHLSPLPAPSKPPLRLKKPPTGQAKPAKRAFLIKRPR
jgi:hypothetical protein